MPGMTASVYVLFCSSGTSGTIVTALIVAGEVHLPSVKRYVLAGINFTGTGIAALGSIAVMPCVRWYITMWPSSVAGSTGEVSVICIAASNVPKPSSWFSVVVRIAFAAAVSHAGGGI